MFKHLFRGSRVKTPDSAACRPATLIAIGGHAELGFLFLAPSDEDIQRGLDAWRWLPISELAPIAVSVFGDVFFEGPQGIVVLDTVEGKLVQVAGDAANLVALLQSEKARDNLLFAGLVISARERGLRLGPGECYDFKVAPILGGPIAAEEVYSISLVVKLHIAGQLHDQIKDLPDGTRISGFKISD